LGEGNGDEHLTDSQIDNAVTKGYITADEAATLKEILLSEK
jgi:hypothetical protein